MPRGGLACEPPSSEARAGQKAVQGSPARGAGAGQLPPARPAGRQPTGWPPPSDARSTARPGGNLETRAGWGSGPVTLCACAPEPASTFGACAVPGARSGRAAAAAGEAGGVKGRMRPGDFWGGEEVQGGGVAASPHLAVRERVRRFRLPAREKAGGRRGLSEGGGGSHCSCGHRSLLLLLREAPSTPPFPRPGPNLVATKWRMGSWTWTASSPGC